MPSLGKLTDVVASYDPKPGLHFHLAGYVCGTACFRKSWMEGWVTFARIFINRPDGCRFAVVRRVVLANEGEGMATIIVNKLEDAWCVLDLLDDALTRGVERGPELRAPIAIWSGPNEDACIMWAMAHYGR